jgi:hypothetical protein
MMGFHDLAHHPDATTTPGLLLYRFGAALVFFTATIGEDSIYPTLKMAMETFQTAQPPPPDGEPK